MKEMILTTVIAIYGAFISSILLFFKIKESVAQGKKFIVEIECTCSPILHDGSSSLSGRYFDQEISIVATNKSVKQNTIRKIYFIAAKSLLGVFILKAEPIKFSFIPKIIYPITLEHSEQIEIQYLLNMSVTEFHQSKESNIQILEKYLKKGKTYIHVVIEDTLGTTYHSEGYYLPKLIGEFYKNEETYTTKEYRNNRYRKL